MGGADHGAGAPPDHDELIARLRARVADPNGRTEFAPSQFESTIRSLSLGGMLSFGASLADSLRRVVDSNRAGRMPDPDVSATAAQLERDMSTPTPAPRGALRLASIDDVRAAEAALGLSLPAFLVRLYVEVGDGGFGPGSGLVPLQRLVREAQEFRSGEVLPRGRGWPASLIPLVERDPGWFCVDVETGAIIEWDPEDLAERSSEERFRRSFSDAPPSIETWLAKWLRKMAAADRKPSEDERWARMAARAQTPEGVARQEARTRRYLAQMSPEDRKAFGFDEPYPDIDDDPNRKP